MIKAHYPNIKTIFITLENIIRPSSLIRRQKRSFLKGTAHRKRTTKLRRNTSLLVRLEGVE